MWMATRWRPPQTLRSIISISAAPKQSLLVSSANREYLSSRCFADCLCCARFDQKKFFFEKQTCNFWTSLGTKIALRKIWINIMELTGELMRDVETVMSETSMMMPPTFIHTATSTHSNNELLARETNKENESANFDPSGDVELVDAVGPSQMAGRKRKRAATRSRSRTAKKPRSGVASRTRSRSKRGNSATEHADYVCSVCGSHKNSTKKTMRSKKQK